MAALVNAIGPKISMDASTVYDLEVSIGRQACLSVIIDLHCIVRLVFFSASRLYAPIIDLDALGP